MFSTEKSLNKIKKMLIKKIKNKNLKIGIIGLGYVGLPRAMQFCAKKFTVYGFDTDSHKINILRRGKSYIINVKKFYY